MSLQPHTAPVTEQKHEAPLILIVDDNSQMRALIRVVLAEISERVVECADGSQALAAYKDCSPAWVLMDIRMRTLDGIAATRQIIDAHAEARIVIVTDYGDDDLRKAAFVAGARDYVLKDDLLRLREIIRNDER